MRKQTVVGWCLIGAAAFWIATGCATSPEPELAATDQKADVEDGREYIKWGYSLPDGLRIASETHKPVMVNFYAPWCGTCQLMDRRVHTREDIVKTSWSFVPVKIDVDEKRAVAAKYGVRELPTTIFLTSSGREISRMSGFMPAEAVVQRMEQAIMAESSAY